MKTGAGEEQAPNEPPRQQGSCSMNTAFTSHRRLSSSAAGVPRGTNLPRTTRLTHSSAPRKISAYFFFLAWHFPHGLCAWLWGREGSVGWVKPVSSWHPWRDARQAPGWGFPRGRCGHPILVMPNIPPRCCCTSALCGAAAALPGACHPGTTGSHHPGTTGPQGTRSHSPLRTRFYHPLGAK